MKWLVIREADHYAYWFDHDTTAKQFAALEAKRTGSRFFVAPTVVSVEQRSIGISYANESGVVRDGVGSYVVCMPPPLRLPDVQKFHDARMEGNPKKFIDLVKGLMKPGHTAEVIDVEFKEVPPVIDAELEAIG